MGFNRENYVKIKSEYDGKYLRAEEDAIFRKHEVHTNVPEIAQLDKALERLGFDIYLASLSGDLASLEEIKSQSNRLLEKRKKLMVEAGYPENYTEVQYECALCKDTGVVDYRMCKCMKEKLILAGLESSGMSELIKNQTFENFDLSFYSGEARARMATILDLAKKYANEFDANKSGSIILMGNTGLGKTHISSAMGGVIISKGNDVYYSTAIDMVADFESERFTNAKPDKSLTDKYMTCDLLIIDDLGTELINQFTTSCLYTVINSRLVKKKPTIISTNFTREELRKKYMDRITSRIFGEFLVFPFMGTDIREKKLQVK